MLPKRFNLSRNTQGRDHLGDAWSFSSFPEPLMWGACWTHSTGLENAAL